MGLEVVRPGLGPTRGERELRPWLLAVGAVVSALVAVMGMWGLVGYVTAHAPIGTSCGNACPSFSLGSAKPLTTYNRSGQSFFPYGTVVSSVGAHLPVDELGVSLTASNGQSSGYAYAGLTSGAGGCWVGNYHSGWSSGMPSTAAPGASSCGPSGPSITDPVAVGDTIIVATNAPVPSLGASISVHSGTSTVNAVLP